MAGARLALIVANDEYDDPGLKRLEAPAHDADALADILGDPGVGAFDVRVLHNETAQTIRTAVEDFFVDRTADDLLLLHFSCHGVKNADGELFLALKDTRPNRLASTGLAADFVNRQMATSRAQRIALFLDCCYGGAFPRGMMVRATGDAQVRDTFAKQEDLGGGRGRVVVTASNAMQYSFEAGQLTDDAVRPSVFTGALVDALSTGEADKDADGWIGMNELFTYVADKVHEVSPNQTPQMWTFGAQGDIFVARSRIRRVRPTPLEPALAEAMANPLPAARYGLVDLFRERLGSQDLGVALAAYQALSSMVGDDSRKLSDAATAALAHAALKVNPPGLDLTVDAAGSATGVLTLSGPPIATSVTARSDVPWLRIEYDDPRLRVFAAGSGQPGSAIGNVTLKSPIGELEVPVRVTSGQAGPPPPAPAVPPAPPEPPRGPERTPEPRSRRPLLLGGAAATVIALGVGFVVTRGDNTNTKLQAQLPGGTSAPLLPRGEPLPEGTLLWADQAGAWRIKYGVPGGTVSELATTDASSATWPAVTPDGRTVIYQTVPIANPHDYAHTSLRAIATDGSGDRVILEGADFCPNPGRPAVGPKGLIAVACFDSRGRRAPGLRIITSDGQLRTTIDPANIVGSPTWLPDGNSLVYWRQTPQHVGALQAQNLYVAAADGTSDPRSLTDGAVRDSQPAVSPDGRSVVFVRSLGQANDSDLWLTGLAAGAQPTRLAGSVAGQAEQEPTWSSSGGIVFTGDGGLMQLDSTDAESAKPVFPDGYEADAHMAAFATR